MDVTGSQILTSHGVDNEYLCAVLPCGLNFHPLLDTSNDLKMEAVIFSETLTLVRIWKVAVVLYLR